MKILNCQAKKIVNWTQTINKTADDLLNEKWK
jgi:hypothetical protein